MDVWMDGVFHKQESIRNDRVCYVCVCVHKCACVWVPICTLCASSQCAMGSDYIYIYIIHRSSNYSYICISRMCWAAALVRIQTHIVHLLKYKLCQSDNYGFTVHL